MIAALLSRIAGSKAMTWAGVGLIALIAVTVHVFAANLSVERQIAAAMAERDAHWHGEIETANRIADQMRADQEAAAARADAIAKGEIDRLQNSLAVLEAKNAALPNGHRCGLDAGRVRLLPN